MQSNMENIHHGSTGFSVTKSVEHFETENPHEYDSSQYVDEPGCVPIENPPVQTAPPLQTPTLTQPMTSHPVTAPVMTQSTNIVQVGPGPSNVPVVPSASPVQVRATLQVPLVYTKPITGMGPMTGQFLVKRLDNHTNNLVIIPPAGFMLKSLGKPTLNNQPQQLTVENRTHGQRRTLSPVINNGPEPKKARITQNIQSGPVGPMNSRGQRNNPTISSVQVTPPVDSSNRFDISRYQPRGVQESNFIEDDDVTEQIPEIQQNVSEPNQLGGDEQLFDLVPVSEPEYEIGCSGDKINHDDVHEDQYLVSEEHTPALTEREVFDIIDKLGDSHKQAEVPMHSKYYFYVYL